MSETWRCPHCGGREIEVTGMQVYEVNRTISFDDEVFHEAEPSPDADNMKITLVECGSCGGWDEDDRGWHMTEREWFEEKLARAGDAAMDLARDA